MQVLMSHAASPAARGAADALRAAGHTVHACREAGTTGFACVALSGDECPLESHPIDVALAMRTHPSSTALPFEDGVRCAARRHVPLVVAGAVAPNPFAPWTTVERPGRDVVDAVEEAATLPIRELSALATSALRAALVSAGDSDAGAAAAVRRHDGRLRVTLTVPTDDVARPARDLAAVRVHQALRGVEHWASGIDVCFASARPLTNP